MLSFDMNAIQNKAVQVDGELSPSDPVWQEDDVRPAEPVHVSGRLSTAGPGRFFFSGHVEGTAVSACRRCLTDVRAGVDEDVQFLFVEPDDEGAEDPDVFLLDSREGTIDLRPAVREHWMVSVPRYPVCREDCQGFCPTCGTDLNEQQCDCAPQTTDTRWDALRNLRGNSD